MLALLHPPSLYPFGDILKCGGFFFDKWFRKSHLETSMTIFSEQIIEQLIQVEAGIHYNELPPAERVPFVVVRRESLIILSAPHGAITFRNNNDEIWHEEDEYTAGMALLISEICGVSAIAMNWKCKDYDPNHTNRDDLPYKREIKKLIDELSVQFVIDLHGAALHSPTLDKDQTIDLGIRQNNKADKPSFKLIHIEKLEHFLCTSESEFEPTEFIVRRNKFPAKGPGTITTFASKQKIPNTGIHVQAVQIEMKPQVRVAQRFKSASLYKSCGPFTASSSSILHMLQSLVNFVEYLKTYKESA
jgi:hypothetical protein